MQVNKIPLFRYQTFRANNTTGNNHRNTYLQANKPKIELSSLNTIKSQAKEIEQERKTEKIIKTSSTVYNELEQAKLMALAKLRLVNEGKGNWNHKEAMNYMLDSNDYLALRNGFYYVMTDSEEKKGSKLVTRIFDSTSVMFDENGVVQKIEQGDCTIFTDSYYFSGNTKGTPFLVCEGYKTLNGVSKAQKAYYVDKDCAYTNLSVGNGKKSFDEYYQFTQIPNGTVLQRFENSQGTKLNFADCIMRYRLSEDGEENIVSLKQN